MTVNSKEQRFESSVKLMSKNSISVHQLYKLSSVLYCIHVHYILHVPVPHSSLEGIVSRDGIVFRRPVTVCVPTNGRRRIMFRRRFENVILLIIKISCSKIKPTGVIEKVVI